MTENHIKELISKNFIRAIANRQGYKVSSSDPDYGSDLTIIEVAKLRGADGNIVRYLDSGRVIDLQLKCTTESSISYLAETLRYPLEAKTYNDLIYRRDNNFPLILVLFVLPSDNTNWIFCDENMLKIQRHAFWFLPNEDDVPTENGRNITIEISKANMITIDSIRELFDKVYS